MIEFVAASCFALAILQTFFAGQLRKVSHVLGEVELAFAMWGSIFLLYLATQGGAWTYLQSLSYTEPLFVFVVLLVSATRPITQFAERVIERLATFLPGPPAIRFYIVALTLGPWLGSLITEPAAMTVVALMLKRRYFETNLSTKFMYATLALLFVNVSVGGTFTNFAAPPILMVARAWNWDALNMLTHFAWKAALATTLSTLLMAWRFRGELRELEAAESTTTFNVPHGVTTSHFVILGLILANAARPIFFIVGLAIYLLLYACTRAYQTPLRVRAAAMVALFLLGLVILGPWQTWWLEPLLKPLSSASLYMGAIGLTSILDNAALTYLGAQLPNLGESDRYILVAGAVVGGGLSVIANAPNPAGFALLNDTFEPRGIEAGRLVLAAAIPTLISALCFWLL